MLPSGCHLPHLLIGTSSSPLLPRCALGWTCQLAFQLVLQVRLARLQRRFLGMGGSYCKIHPSHAQRHQKALYGVPRDTK